MRDDDIIEAPIGAGSVLFMRRRQKLYLLNGSASVAWRAFVSAGAGGGIASIAGALQAHYGLPPEDAASAARGVLASWQDAGLAPGTLTHEPSPVDGNWVIPQPALRPLEGRHAAAVIAGVPFALHVPDNALGASVLGALGSRQSPDGGCYAHLLEFEGDRGNWLLRLNGEVYAVSGQMQDEPASLALGLVTDLATQSEERLLVIHGAGVAGRNGRTMLLVAPSGRGKTTLAAALNARGLALLSDDVVPIDRSGAPVPLGLPMCIKSGSLEVLRTFRRDADDAPPVWRQQQAVRFVPPLPHPLPARLSVALLLFPAYRPGGARHA